MQSPVAIPPESIVINESPLSKPTTLLLRTNRPYLYNSWIVNNRLRLKNEKLTKRQQSSCRIAFYSLWICVSASVMIIVIYRFTDECLITTEANKFIMNCLRHWLFLAAICTSLLACCGVIVGACRYFRSQTFNFLYDHDPHRHLAAANSLLPMTETSHSYYSPTVSTNGISIIPSRQIQQCDDELTNSTINSSLINISPQRKIPPFNYEELPSDSNSTMISLSPNINNNKKIFFSMSTSILPLPYFKSSSSRTSDMTKTSSIFEDPCSSTFDSYTTCLADEAIWKQQPRLSLPH